MDFLLEKDHAMAAAGEHCRRRGPCRATSDHDDIALLRHNTVSKIFVQASRSKLVVGETL
jgi:hypothetical protein